MAFNTVAARVGSIAATCSLVAIAMWSGPTSRAQTSNCTPRHASRSGDVDWRSHNFDLRNGHYSPVDDINVSNVAQLTLKWSFDAHAADIVTQVTPLVVDGIGSEFMS